MPRGGTAKQNQTYSTATDISNQGSNRNSALYSTLQPMFQTEATNPTASPIFNDLNTASQQSTGGAVAAAKGQAGLSALRTGNRGTFQTTLDDVTRNAMKTNSQNALNSVSQIQNQGVGGLQGLYGSNLQQTLGGLNAQAGIANNQASQPGWFQNLMQFMGTGAQGAAAGAKIAAM